MYRTHPRIRTEKLSVPRSTEDGSPSAMTLFVARPEGEANGRRPGLLLIQEIFGVNGHIRDVACRLAGEGYVVVAPDLLYRHGPWLTFGYDQGQEAIAHVRSLNEELIVGDMAAALAHLSVQPDVDPARLGSIGFCLGGRASLIAAVRLNEQIRAAAIFYGGGIVADHPAALVHRVDQVRCPVIGFFGALDNHIPPEHVQQLEAALSAAGVQNEIYCYPNANHGFFCDARAGYTPQAAQDAWYRTLRFFEQNLGPVPEVEWA